jgi:streptomycin 6-kinase
VLDVPDVVREKALSIGAAEWLDGLPELVREIEADWEITVGAAFPFSTEAFVATVACADDTPAVLKLIVPREGDAAAREATALRLAGGEGCARLLKEDLGRGALLLEQLGRPLSELGLPLQARHEILVTAAQRVWRPPPDSGLPTGGEKARSLGRFITAMWDELGGPCSRAAVDHALECAERRENAHRDDQAVLVHGDVHQWNALESVEGFKLVDPDGLLAEPEYDLGIIMREDPLEGDLRHRSAWLAEQTGLDEEAIWEWGVVERVSTGLLGTRVGMQPVARQMLDAAESITG